jgi:hypothetical protein
MQRGRGSHSEEGAFRGGELLVGQDSFAVQLPQFSQPAQHRIRIGGGTSEPVSLFHSSRMRSPSNDAVPSPAEAVSGTPGPGMR